MPNASFPFSIKPTLLLQSFLIPLFLLFLPVPSFLTCFIILFLVHFVTFIIFPLFLPWLLFLLLLDSLFLLLDSLFLFLDSLFLLLDWLFLLLSSLLVSLHFLLFSIHRFVLVVIGYFFLHCLHLLYLIPWVVQHSWDHHKNGTSAQFQYQS